MVYFISKIFLKSKTIKIKKKFDTKYIHIPWGVTEVLDEISPDVVIGSEYNPTVIQSLIYCKRNKIPFISWTDGTLYSERNINLLQKVLRKVIVGSASAYIASSTKSREAQLAYGATKEKCFIITPIGDDTDPIRRHIEGIIDAAIAPALADKYEIIVAHKISEPGSITKQIISEIYNAKLVIANITNRNPNVMYELALRHAIGKPVITIAEKGTPLPSDIVTQRAIFYYNDAKGVLELRDELKKAEEEIDFENKSGPIIDVLGDISHDEVILQQAKLNDGDILQPLEYIIGRLNRIEEAIISSRKQTIRYDLGEQLPRKTGFGFRYDEINRSCNKTVLRNRLSRVLSVDPHAIVDEVIIDYDKRTILIIVIMNDLLDVPEIYHFFQKVLSEFGFKNVIPEFGELCDFNK